MSKGKGPVRRTELALSIFPAFNPKSKLPEIFEYVDLESVIGIELISYREEKNVHLGKRRERTMNELDDFYSS
ncbi:MAG TPA: restriction endonuclease subunit S, partial [Spirochaetaceae bacterium]|nr:restriction endonuclease subunit S [Spirochaetaceae bacterium]